ncbi:MULTISPECIES: hypothetical protein [Blautia]|uniref:hypothetical protein n=1 Tax=Blautia TaxID=572511 RepID=UPI00156F2918|nr:MULTISPECIES: hypothetical protein [Blautia]NSK43705.1 hypothetical protein [Blautia luti]NSK84984.1 hypothetical protein [Blautia luti]NSY30939.1 hypothetical protein [Blautia sp. MSK.21.1]
MDTEVNQLKRSLGRAFLWLLLLLIVATGTTFAWFNLTGMRHTNGRNRKQGRQYTTDFHQRIRTF